MYPLDCFQFCVSTQARGFAFADSLCLAVKSLCVSRSLTSLAPRPRHRTVNTCCFPLSQPFDRIFRKEGEDLVFTALQGGPLRLNVFRKRVFTPAAAAIGKPDLVPHDLRDTAASLAISSGASIKAVQRMLGHASAAMTLDTYGSLFEEDLEALAKRLEERFG